MTPELQKEFDELNKYKEFVHLFWEFIDEIDYDKQTQIMTIIFDENNEIDLFVEKTIADKFYEVFTLMEQENDIQQDGVEEND